MKEDVFVAQQSKQIYWWFRKFFLRERWRNSSCSATRRPNPRVALSEFSQLQTDFSGFCDAYFGRGLFPNPPKRPTGRWLSRKTLTWICLVCSGLKKTFLKIIFFSRSDYFVYVNFKYTLYRRVHASIQKAFFPAAGVDQRFQSFWFVLILLVATADCSPQFTAYFYQNNDSARADSVTLYYVILVSIGLADVRR